MTLDEAFNYVRKAVFSDRDARSAMRAYLDNRGFASLSEMRDAEPDAVIAFAVALKAMDEQLGP